MTEAAEHLKSQLLELPSGDRAALARFLIDSLDQEVELEDEDAWDAELARRAEEIRSGQAQGEPAEQVLAELRKKYS